MLSQWDRLPPTAVLAFALMYMVARGEAPPLAFFGGTMPAGYMTAENLWREAVIIGGSAWGLLWIVGASLFLFAKSESGGILSILEPIRGTLPTGIVAMFLCLLVSLSHGGAWVYIGLGLLMACALAGMAVSLKRLPHLTPLDGPPDGVGGDAGGRAFGIFYYCKADPRILAPKRGGGITLNLAHGRGLCILAFGVALPLGLAALASFASFSSFPSSGGLF